ncbi:MAG: hypothetical protein COA69_14365 [Robiginitomaculum sp.]|nr:MAG: hypothetical protein COA69_14365 [Robiginitomaculum sp.]
MAENVKGVSAGGNRKDYKFTDIFLAPNRETMNMTASIFNLGIGPIHALVCTDTKSDIWSLL